MLIWRDEGRLRSRSVGIEDHRAARLCSVCERRSNVMLVGMFALVTLVATGLLVYYLWRVPVGPACPRCGGLVRRLREPVRRRWAWSPLRWWTDVARCPSCGWGGRLRRGPGPELAETRHSEQSRGTR